MPPSRTARLASFIKDALAVRLKPVTDLADYSQPRGPIWFGELPLDGSSCRSVFAHNTTGDAWMALRRRKEPARPLIPAICRGWVDERAISSTTEPALAAELDAEDGSGRLLLADAPAVAHAWTAWLDAHWRPWAREHLAWEGHHRLYQSVFQARERLVGQEDTMEVLLGLGFLQWTRQPGPAIRRHVVTFRGELALDPGTGELTFRFAPDGYQPRVELDMLPDTSRAILMRLLGTPEDMVREIDGLLDLEPIHDLLGRIANTLSDSLEYSQEIKKGDADALFFAPACFFRKKGLRGLESLLAAIQKDDITQHSPLWRRLAEEDEGSGAPGAPREHSSDKLPFIYFPAPSNHEQQEIVRRASSEVGLVVQGPPGTGKSHTIANLISHLLANGERVLVTAHTSQALQVLKTKLDKDLQALCVSLLGTGSEGSADLERSVHGIIQRLDQHNPEKLARDAEKAEAEARDLELKQAQLDTRLARAREAEARSVEPVMGYAGTRVEIRERLREESETLGWIPGRVDPDREPDLERLSPLLAYHASLDANIRHEALLPALDLPTADELRKLVTDVNVLERSVSSRPSSGLDLPSDHESLESLLDLLRDWYQEVLVPQQMVRHDESRVRGPRVHREPPLLAHATDVVPVEHHEGQPEALVQLLFPLQRHRRRRRDDDAPDALAHQQLADDEPGLDRLAQPHIVRDEQVDARQQ